MLRKSFLALIITGLILAGCQSNPATPDTAVPEGTSAPAVHSSSHHSLGFYGLAMDTENFAVDVIPLRSGNWHFNVTGILNSTMGVAAVMVPGESDPPTGLFVLDITLTHPFGTKPQLSGFDVKGILITPGTLSFGGYTFADLDETQLENADGFSRWWNPVEFTSSGMLGYTHGNLAIGSTALLSATVNPYKYFADILGPNESLSWISGAPLDNPDGRGVFTAGTANTRRYRIRFPLDPGPKIIYGYAVDASWIAPSPNPPMEIPDDFPMNANQPEAYRVVISPLGNSLYYDSETATGGGVLKLQINVHDWQGQALGNVVPEVGDVVINAPILTSTDFPCSFMNATTDKARYLLCTDAIDPTASGRTIITCRVDSTDGSTYQQTGDPAPASILSAFQTLVIDIPDPECAVDANNTFGEAESIDFGQSIDGQVCLPDDESDYYSFEIPYNYEASGEIRIFSDASGNNFTLYDSSFTDIIDSTFSGGSTKYSLDDLELLPGTYFLRVRATDPSSIAVYLLDMDATLIDVSPSSPEFVTPSTLFCNADYVWIIGDYAYLAGGKGAFVYDLSSPAMPQYVGSTYGDAMYWDDAEFQFPYCYFIGETGCGAGFYIGMVDFSNHENPQFHAHLIDSTVYLDAIAMDSQYIYVASYDMLDAVITVYDYATDPMAPAMVTAFPPSAQVYCMDIAYPDTTDALLAVTSVDNKLSTYTISDLMSIALDEQIPFTAVAVFDIEVYDHYIFFVEGYTAYSDGYLLSADLDPVLHGADSLNLPGFSRYIDIEYPCACIADGQQGLTVCNITDPYALAGLAVVPVQGSAISLDAEGTLCGVLPYGGGLEVLDINNPSLPVFMSKLNVVNQPRTGELVDDYLFVADTGGRSDIVTLDISSPSHPLIVDRDENPVLAYCSAHDGNTMVTASGTDYSLWNISDPSSPALTGYWTPGGPTIWGVGIMGTHLYMGKTVGQVVVYDITNPAAPFITDTVVIPEMPRGLEIHEDTIYLPCDLGVMYLSLTDPAHPIYEGLYNSASAGRGLICDGDWMYFGMHEGMEIIDISSPLSPALISSLPTADNDMSNLAVHGQYLFIESSTSRPYAMRVQPANDPAFFGHVHNFDPAGADDLVWIDGYLYEFSYNNMGIFIWDLY